MEFNFQKIVLIVFLLILVVALILIGIKMNKKINNNWPPYVANCPDYWLDLGGDGSQCFNNKELGSCNIPISETDKNTKDFTVSAYTGSDGLCKKKKWANACGVAWDGINYGVKDPCET